MNRFILLTFGFLGWAFYEMSGGADFEPRSIQLARAQPVTEDPLPSTRSGSASVTQASITPVAFVETNPTATVGVTRQSLNLTSLKDVIDTTDTVQPVIRETVQNVSLPTTSDEDDTGVPRNVGSVTSSAGTPAIIPSLIDPNDGIAAALDQALADIRTVAGNSVNVRGGPGTEFGVVNRLTRGAEVRILQDDGSGWVLMEPVNGGPEGWMADFLLTSG